jgi:hypothetical protein
MQGPRPGLPQPPSTARAGDSARLKAIEERVAMTYGAFGDGPDLEEVERRVLSDSFLKPTLRIVLGVLGASTFLSFLSHPAFDGPAAWANSFRLDSAFIVVWAPILAFAMTRYKTWKSVRIYLVLCLFIEAFTETMFTEMGEGGYWDTVMWPAAVAFFGTLKEFAGVPGASLPVFTVVTVWLLHRAVKGPKPEGWEPPPKWAKQALYVFFGTVLGLTALGIGAGNGAIEPAFRQTIHLVHLPLVAFVFLYALRIPEDLAAVGTAFVVCALVRSAIVMWVYFAVCLPAGITELDGKPEWCTNHSDSVLFVVSIVILITNALERRTSRTTWRAVAAGAFILLAVVLNNRRLAFVSLGAAPFVLYLALRPSRRKRRVTMLMALAVPLFAGYVLVGSEMPGSSAVWKPAKLVTSVLDQKDSSSQSRDIENENLIYTLRMSPFVPRGFGSDYEYSPNNPPVDLTGVFANFRLIAHNGVLWIWSLAGVAGFTLLWLVYPLAGTMAVRAYRAAPTPLERSAALSALGAVVVCVIQIWGDQGFNSYLTLVTFGVAYAVATRLAARYS